jgi:TRAP transporter TAXI family solute receptor
MNSNNLFSRSALLLTLLLSLLAGPASAEQRFLALGTASKSGVYYPVGKEVCRLINAQRLDHGTRCVAFETGGSVYNIYAIASRDMDIAITRVDLAWDAFQVADSFAGLPEGRNLRSVVSLYNMPVGILVRKDSGISSLEDFPGRSINIGNLGSGRRDIANMLFEIMGWKKSIFSSVYEYKTSDMEKEFCSGGLDILIGAFAVPAAFYDRLTSECEAVFLSLPADIITKAIKEAPAFSEGVIPGGLYPANPADVATIQINTLLVSSTETDKDAIQQLLTSLFDHLDTFREAHPALTGFGIDNIYQAGKTLPHHPGVVEFLKSRNLPLSKNANKVQ